MYIKHSVGSDFRPAWIQLHSEGDVMCMHNEVHLGKTLLLPAVFFLVSLLIVSVRACLSENRSGFLGLCSDGR